MLKKFIFIISGILLAATVSAAPQKGSQGMNISSLEFKDGGIIPAKFSCDGLGTNPALSIENIPIGTKSLALIIDDPDATIGTFVHWVVYGIPPVNYIKENSVPGIQGKNNSGGIDYCSPCPPSGIHRYFFKVYALDIEINRPGLDKTSLLKIMDGHILDKAELIGRYKRG